MDAICTYSIIIIFILLIYIIVKRQEYNSDKKRLHNLERYVYDYLIPNIYDAHRRLNDIESTQINKDKFQEPQKNLIPEPPKKPSQYYHRPLAEEVPPPPYSTEPPRSPEPVPTYEPYSKDKEAISMELEFGSKWLQYIGIFIVIITFLLLGAYTIQFITPLQENILMYFSSFILLAFGEYLYRAKDSKLYGLGLVYGGLITLYISCASSHYAYDFIDFQTFILFMIIAETTNLILGFRYNSNLMISKGLLITFIIISIARVENFANPLEYSILLPMVVAIGSVVIFIRKNTELMLFFMMLSYLWVALSVLLLDNFVLIPLLSTTIIIMILTIVQQNTEENKSTVLLFDENIEYPLFLIALVLSYVVLIFTTSITALRDVGNMFIYDEWAYLILLFIIQFIFTQKVKQREDDMLFTILPFICLILIGLFTVNIDNSIFFYLTLIFIVLAMNYKAISKINNLNIICFLSVITLIAGRVLILLRSPEPTVALNYYYEGILVFFTLIFSFLNYRFYKDKWTINDSNFRIYPVLFFLFLLYFATNSDLSFGYFIIPIILLFTAYIAHDALTFNLSYLISTYNIFRYFSDTETYPEIFIISSLVLFFFAIVHEITEQKKVLATSTALISSVMFIISIAVTYGNDIITTLVWASFGIFAIMVGIKSNTYYFRWIGLFCLLISILKAFTIDISVLSFEMRILSFAALGFALLIISYIYTRYKSRIIEALGLKNQRNNNLNDRYPSQPPPPSKKY